MSDLLINFKGLEKANIQKLTHKKNKSIKNISSVKSEEDIDSKRVISAIKSKFYNHKYQLNNVYIYEWESDLFTVSESGYIYEIEVKITKSDFKDDFNKKDKHVLLESKDPSKDLMKPNRFYYATPRNLLPASSIPDYAGLLEVDPNTREVFITKEAPFLHKNKGIDHLKDILLEKFYWRYKELSD